jgi:hypothetical protein
VLKLAPEMVEVRLQLAKHGFLFFFAVLPALLVGRERFEKACENPGCEDVHARARASKES